MSDNKKPIRPAPPKSWQGDDFPATVAQWLSDAPLDLSDEQIRDAIRWAARSYLREHIRDYTYDLIITYGEEARHRVFAKLRESGNKSIHGLEDRDLWPFCLALREIERDIYHVGQQET